jgi:hypothetical protein
LFILVSSLAWSQRSLEKSALHNLQKGKWEKSRNQLVKTLRRDTLNAPARYVYSTYYFTPGNPAFHIDSAFQYVTQAAVDFQHSSAKQKERMKRFPLDSLILINRRKAIDSAAFERAMSVNTELGYVDFINRFAHALQVERAIELRNEVAYVDALKLNTYESYQNFLTKYPQASRVADARQRYDKLLYEAKTKDQKLVSFEMFIEAYPQSPYRTQAEQQVLERSTASGNPQLFLDFIHRYPESTHVSKARNLAYYLFKEEGVIPEELLTDSIRAVQVLEQGYLIPFYNNGLYGFMNAQGEEIVEPFASEVDHEIICGNITEEILIANDQIRTRNGTVLYRGHALEVDDIDYGFLLIYDNTCGTVIHKSAFLIERCVDDAVVLAGAYLAVKTQEKWTLYTLTGRQLPVGTFEQVESIDNILVLKRDGAYRLIHREEIAKALDQNEVMYSPSFDEVKRWDEANIWVRVGNTIGLLDMQLNEVLALSHREILQTFFGASLKSPSGFTLWNLKKGETMHYDTIQLQKPWVAGKAEGGWSLLDDTLTPVSNATFDSIYFIGPFSIGIRKDSLHTYFSSTVSITLNNLAGMKFLPGRDSAYYLVVEEGDKKTVYTEKGELLFTAGYDRIEYIGDQLFLTIRKEKRGIINQQGKVVVQPEFDAMGNLNDGTMPVLKDKKFGYLDVVNRREIKPVYEKNLVRYNHHYLIAFKGGKVGLIDWSNKPVTGFDYDEIQFWNDSTAIVKQNQSWVIYNFIEKKTVADKIRDFKWLRNDISEKIIRIHQENQYGIISNRKGVVLAATYSDIINLGSPSRPLYFTEKHVEEASIYVVIYYDEDGKFLRRQVFEADDYDEIYCTQN